MTDKLPIINEPLLDEFRMAARCEWCGRHWAHVTLQPHHIFKRQMGGGARMDIRINLIALCAGWGSKWCHQRAEDGFLILRGELLLIVAKREKTTVAAIVEEVNRLLWGRR